MLETFQTVWFCCNLWNILNEEKCIDSVTCPLATKEFDKTFKYLKKQIILDRYTSKLLLGFPSLILNKCEKSHTYK